jgi:uncharacterized protein
LQFLREADPNISGINVETVETPEGMEGFREELLSLLQKYIETAIKTDSDSVMRIVKLSHQGKGSNVEFDLDDESRGTRKMLTMLVPALDAIKHGRVVIIDEIESSLHPLLATEFIRMFTSRKNENGAQLVFTTHDTNILESKLLRRDQIWFAEKSRFGETSLYSLSELSVRPSDNIYRGYLQGRFGAIPYLGGVDRLLNKEDAHTGAD